MDFVLENDYLKVTVTSKGAQVASVLRKIDGVEHMWQWFHTWFVILFESIQS